VSSNFWHGKQVLLTGHTGFKGAWLSLWLCQMGATVTGISLPPCGVPNLFTLAEIGRIIKSHFVDIRDADVVSKIVKNVKPEIVFHLAAQALVRPSYRDPLETFTTNVIGTANVLNALRGIDSVRAVVAVTSDKVYKNHENNKPYCEADELGGYDPYSSSKAASEMIITSFKDSYLTEQEVAVASARAGNVIGGGDWSEDRLIPDAVRAWDSGLTLEIRRPNSVRPWQHVLEPLSGYLILAEKLYINSSFAGAFNFGPKNHEATTVQKVIELAKKAYGRGNILWVDSIEGPHEANFLSLDTSKSHEILGVTPRWDLEEAIERTMGWYQNQKNGMQARKLCIDDIEAFSNT
jgi:CDP-glucose 4,6-dehydratase